MFQNKYLKQLQEVQAQIINCNENIEKLYVPTFSSNIEYKNISYLFDHLRYGGNNMDVDRFLGGVSGDKEVIYNYLRELGEYFINIVDYQNANERYHEELRQLREKECQLKNKLGIY